ncbi:MAG: SapB/AmfS family lantipeptide [Pseudonocardiales bacterium]|nr:SapB/AmfS family lantipeptide [Pseudonocardiales bacterium]PZS35303.1 MAG: SapB/AmfS family lantipeptide [Pseudonocardiales bacterium]
MTLLDLQDMETPEAPNGPLAGHRSGSGCGSDISLLLCG